MGGLLRGHFRTVGLDINSSWFKWVLFGKKRLTIINRVLMFAGTSDHGLVYGA